MKDVSLLLRPVPKRSVADMLEEYDLRPMRSEEFERTFGHLPTDSEGWLMTAYRDLRPAAAGRLR